MSHRTMRHRSSGNGGCGLASLGCGIQLIILSIYLTLGGVSVNYLLNVWLEKDIPWYADVAIGVLAGVTVPAAVITWILRFFGAV